MFFSSFYNSIFLSVLYFCWTIESSPLRCRVESGRSLAARKVEVWLKRRRAGAKLKIGSFFGLSSCSRAQSCPGGREGGRSVGEKSVP